jgi:beta-lactamase regulating signal transducer with metallopeptidase domain
VRYAVCWVALLCAFVLPVVPFVGVVASTAVMPTVTTSSAAVVSVPHAWWTSGAIVLGLWALWLGIYGTRLATAMLALRRAKACSRPFPATVELRLRHWQHVRQQGRHASLFVSDRVRAAAVLGCGSPVIAVAPALVQHLDPDELDRVIVHEWAHVQRRDDLANGVQLIARLIAGWHPAVWWIDRRLQVERELACDEMTVAVTGSAKSYAACLVKVADLPLGGVSALPAPGALSSSGLATRIRRLVSRREFLSPAWSRGLATVAVVLLSVVSLAVGGYRLVEAAVESTTVQRVVRAQSVQARGLESANTIDQASQPITRTRTLVAARSAAQPAVASPQVDHRPAEPTTTSEPAAPETATIPERSSEAGLPIVPLESAPIDVPATRATAPSTPTPPGETPTDSAWRAAADGGVAIGRESKKAGVATAGFFNRLGKRIAGSF